MTDWGSQPWGGWGERAGEKGKEIQCRDKQQDGRARGKSRKTGRKEE